MEETKVTEILEELRQAYPAYKISSRQTKQPGDRRLIVVKGFNSSDNINDWSANVVCPILWEMQKILEKHEELKGLLRLIFIRDNQFVLHSPDVGARSVFREMREPVYFDVHAERKRQHYVGECRDIKDVLEYLTTTLVWF